MRLPLIALAAWSAPLWGQGSFVSVDPPQKTAVKRGGTAEVRLTAHVRNGYHINSDAPEEDYLIPTRLRWEPGALAAAEILFPKPERRQFSFSDKPIPVFAGQFQIVVRLKADADAPPGPGTLVGKLRYQACSDTTCYRPATAEIRLPYEIQ